MADNEEDSKKKILEEFDITSELSTLVEKNVIPKRIAERIEQKVKEKHIKIQKEQLYKLAEKLKEIMRTYSKTEQPTRKEGTTKIEQPLQKGTDKDMIALVETIEKLQEKINKLEKGEIKYPLGKKSPQRIITTDDVKVHDTIEGAFQEWKLDPLSEIPTDPESVIILMKWLQYLIDRCGHSNLSAILDYYVDIGWISQEAKISLVDYSHGITEEKKTETERKDVTNLPSRDHIQSFLFIQKLKGREFDRHFIDRIDSDLTRITKKLDNYQFK